MLYFRIVLERPGNKDYVSKWYEGQEEYERQMKTWINAMPIAALYFENEEGYICLPGKRLIQESFMYIQTKEENA